MRYPVRDEFGLGLRRDLLNAKNKQPEAWTDLQLMDLGVMHVR